MKRGLIMAIALLTMMVGLMFVNRTESATRSNPATPGSGKTKAPPTQTLIERRQLVRIFVHGDDLYPDVVRVTAGKVLIVAENETQKDIFLVVERKTDGQPQQGIALVKTPHLDKRARRELTLEAGEYVFYEESQPQLQGRLIVDPEG
jgi:hypothetical protein